jgi:hypothetical protein
MAQGKTIRMSDENLYNIAYIVRLVAVCGSSILWISALYSLWRQKRECIKKGTEGIAVLNMWFKKLQTPEGIIYRNRFLRLALYTIIWGLSGHIILGLFFPDSVLELLKQSSKGLD